MCRDILILQILGEELVGTYHMPESVATNTYTNTLRIGILLLNPGAAPRAGNSDLYVHIGDRLASRGIPVFRFDLPGLGDSSGSTPPEIECYWQEVLQGRNDATTLALIDKLKGRFGLSSMVVGGVCAATVPALRVADCYPGAIAGIILMEPIFSLGAGNNPEPPQVGIVATLTAKAKITLRRVFSVRDWLIFLTGDNRTATALHPLRPLLVRIQKKLIGHTLPKDMNVPLFMNWQGSLARGTHTLAIVAIGQGSDRYVAHAIDSLPADMPGKLTLISIPNTNHILTSGPARNIVLESVEKWMTSQFHIALN